MHCCPRSQCNPLYHSRRSTPRLLVAIPLGYSQSNGLGDCVLLGDCLLGRESVREELDFFEVAKTSTDAMAPQQEEHHEPVSEEGAKGWR